MKKKVALVVASAGYQQKEYEDTRKVLVDAGVEVITVSDKPGMAQPHDRSTSELTGATAHVDLTLQGLTVASLDGLFLIGGGGALAHLNTPVMHRLLNEMYALQKPYGAICISPRILAQAQVLRGKKAACWDGDGQAEQSLADGGAVFVQDSVKVDGKVVTANGPHAATAFGQAILTVV